MLNFQPQGFVQRVLTTDLGIMAYYTNASEAREGSTTLVFLHSLGVGLPPLSGLGSMAA
ncbi:MAG: hypothetical protein LVS60_00995 [Nodosilinea sp. LVE1205-7]